MGDLEGAEQSLAKTFVRLEIGYVLTVEQNTASLPIGTTKVLLLQMKWPG